MSTDTELRGSSPVMTAKDVLLEVRNDVKDIGKNVDILVSQRLDERVKVLESGTVKQVENQGLAARVSALEQGQWKIAGISGAVGAVAGVVAAAVSRFSG